MLWRRMETILPLPANITENDLQIYSSNVLYFSITSQIWSDGKAILWFLESYCIAIIPSFEEVDVIVTAEWRVYEQVFKASPGYP